MLCVRQVLPMQCMIAEPVGKLPTCTLFITNNKMVDWAGCRPLVRHIYSILKSMCRGVYIFIVLGCLLAEVQCFQVVRFFNQLSSTLPLLALFC